MGFYCASLQMPEFTKGERQLLAYDVEKTRKIANVQIHVERVIGLVRRKYQNLQSRTLPTEHMATIQGESLALTDKIGVIRCALSNLSVVSWGRKCMYRNVAYKCVQLGVSGKYLVFLVNFRCSQGTKFSQRLCGVLPSFPCRNTAQICCNLLNWAKDS